MQVATEKPTRWKRILLGVAIAAAAAVVALVALVALRQNRTFDAPYPTIRASVEPAVLARGKYLVNGPAHCGDCHGAPDRRDELVAGVEVPFSGGHEFHFPIGTLRAPNITSDLETGIGKQSDDEIARAIRYGVAADGRALFPLMKYQDMSDADLEAVVSYVRTLPPAAHAVRVRELNLLGRVLKALVLEPVGPSGPPPTVTPGPTPEYGRYLATSVAACVGCHTRRNLKTGAATGPLFAGGLRLVEEGGTFITPNLTPDPRTGQITTWSEDTFVARFRMGARVPGTPMPWHAFGRMTDDDLRAIYRFLRSLPPSPAPTSSS